MTIVLIEKPEYKVNFSTYSKEKIHSLSASEKVSYTTREFFNLFSNASNALTGATRRTLRYSHLSFRNIVLGESRSWYFNLPNNPIHFTFYVAIWALSIFGCIAKTTYQELIETYFPERDFLSLFVGKGISTTHIKTKNITIDTSGIPEKISVSSLSQILNEVNFTNPEAAGYMGEVAKKYTPNELRTNLNTFIHNVTNRVAFLGTPNAYDAPKLYAFYKKIDDAVRASLHKIEGAIEGFHTKNPSKETWDQQTKQEYNFLIENRNRFVIDLAIAGKACGARYIGEAMSSYYLYCGGTNYQSHTLQDSLEDFLAEKRRELAEGQIARVKGPIDITHDYTNYMQSFGGLLGIPGTEDIIEHLSTPLSPHTYLPKFFREYNTKFIIDSVQEKITSSFVFRDQMIDWLKDQVNEWSLGGSRASQEEITTKITQILVDSEIQINQDQLEHLTKFQQLLIHLKENKVDLPIDENWRDFIDELFALDKAREWCGDNGLNPISKQAIKQTCNQYIAVLENNLNFELTDLNDELIRWEKIAQIKKIIPLSDASIKNLLEDTSEVDEIVRNRLALDNQPAFLKALNMGDIKEQGLSKKMIEWILVSQGIFLPQTETPSLLPAIQQENSDDQAFFNNIKLFFSEDLKRDVELVLKGSDIPEEKYYSRIILAKGDEVASKFFADAFDTIWTTRGNRIITNHSSLLSLATLKYGPKFISDIFQSYLVKIPFYLYSFYLSKKIAFATYKIFEDLASRKIIPFIINNTHIKIIHSCNKLADGFEWFNNKKYKLTLYLVLAKATLYFVPVSAVRRLSGRIRPMFFLDFGINRDIFSFISGNLSASWKLASNTCNAVSFPFMMISQNYDVQAHQVHRDRFVKTAMQIREQNLAREN